MSEVERYTSQTLPTKRDVHDEMDRFNFMPRIQLEEYDSIKVSSLLISKGLINELTLEKIPSPYYVKSLLILWRFPGFFMTDLLNPKLWSLQSPYYFHNISMQENSSGWKFHVSTFTPKH